MIEDEWCYDEGKDNLLEHEETFIGQIYPRVLYLQGYLEIVLKYSVCP